jgi:flagella basal body P-ring formation protein FlgA
MTRAAALPVALMALAAATATTADDWQDLEQVRAAARTFVLAQPRAGEPPQVSVDALDPRLTLPACRQPLAADLAPGSGRVGLVTVGVRCPGPKPWQVFTTLRVQHFAAALVAARPLARGETLQPGDVVASRQDVAMLAGGYVSDPADIIGKRTKRTLAAGQVLALNALESPPVVRRGRAVTIVARSGGLEVRMAGEALADAAAGEPVNVRSLANRRVLQATAIAADTVQVAM